MNICRDEDWQERPAPWVWVVFLLLLAGLVGVLGCSRLHPMPRPQGHAQPAGGWELTHAGWVQTPVTLKSIVLVDVDRQYRMVWTAHPDGWRGHPASWWCHQQMLEDGRWNDIGSEQLQCPDVPPPLSTAQADLDPKRDQRDQGQTVFGNLEAQEWGLFLVAMGFIGLLLLGIWTLDAWLERRRG